MDQASYSLTGCSWEAKLVPKYLVVTFRVKLLWTLASIFTEPSINRFVELESSSQRSPSAWISFCRVWAIPAMLERLKIQCPSSCKLVWFAKGEICCCPCKSLPLSPSIEELCCSVYFFRKYLQTFGSFSIFRLYVFLCKLKQKRMQSCPPPHIPTEVKVSALNSQPS